MSIQRSTAVWAQSTQKGSSLLALLSMADRADDDGYCWPSHDDIAKRARIKRTYVASNIIPALIKSGELYQHKRRGKSDCYLVLVGLELDEIGAAMVKRFSYSEDRVLSELDKIVNFRGIENGGDLPDEHKTKTRKKSIHIKNLEILEKSFCDLRGCVMPEWNQKTAAGNQKNWRSPLRALLNECDNDLELSLKAMATEISAYKLESKDPRYPMVVPRSFEKRFIARAIQMKIQKKSNGNGNGHDLTQWEKFVIGNKGRIDDFIRPNLEGETEIESWILSNPEATRLPQEILSKY